MDVIDRSVIPSIHAAARHHRSVYVSCLFASFKGMLAELLGSRPAVRTAPCA